MLRTTHAIILDARPKGQPQLTDFATVTRDLPDPGPDQVTVRMKWLSLDPYMRGGMDDAKS